MDLVKHEMSSVGQRAAGQNQHVYGEQPPEVQNGQNLTYTTANVFIPGTLQVFLSGIKLNGDSSDVNRDYDEGGDSQSFTIRLDPGRINGLNVAPCQREDLCVNYETSGAVCV